MKKIFYPLALFMIFTVPGLCAEDELYSSIDGYTISFAGPEYSILPGEITGGGLERYYEITTPFGDTAYAFVSYRDEGPDGGIKDFVIRECRELYREEIYEEQDETISVFHNFLNSGQLAYQVYFSFGEENYSMLAVDMRGSPGKAALLIFAFPPFFGLSEEEQDSILIDIFIDLYIDFSEAAG